MLPSLLKMAKRMPALLTQMSRHYGTPTWLDSRTTMVHDRADVGAAAALVEIVFTERLDFARDFGADHLAALTRGLANAQAHK